MPQRKKSCIGKKTKNAIKLKLFRERETPYNREHRQNTNRLRNQSTRVAESIEIRETRLEVQRLRTRELRSTEPSHLHRLRLEQKRLKYHRTEKALCANLNLEAFNYNKSYDYRYLVIYIHTNYT